MALQYGYVPLATIPGGALSVAAVVMRSASRAGPWAVATTIFLLCFFETPVSIRSTAAHSRRPFRKQGKHLHAGVCTDGGDAHQSRE